MSEAARRWRLVLGAESEPRLGGLKGEDAERDAALDWLYADPRGGGMGAGEWLERTRRLFPGEARGRLRDDALSRRRTAALLADPELLAGLEPTASTLRLLLELKSGGLTPELEALLRETIRRAIEEILRKMRARISRAFPGRRDPFRRSLTPRAADFDARRTIRRNLRHWDAENRRLIPERPQFSSRGRPRLPWRILLCVDQSGSMAESLIHAAVAASILAGLPGIGVKMVLFDHEVLDVSDRLEDPLKLLTSIRMGGGTQIGQALEYCETLVEEPSRTLLVLVTDFCEGGPPGRLTAAVARLAEARVRMLGLTALEDSEGPAFHDERLAARLAGLGMTIGSMSPDHLARWLAEAVE